MTDARALDPRVAGLPVSATLAARERATAAAKAGRKVYQLGLGQSPFPVPGSVVEALRANASEKDYLSVRGLYELRVAVADYHRRRHGIVRSPHDVIVGPGSKELMFLMQLCFDGEIIVPAPAWVSYAPQARLAGRPLTVLQTEASEGFLLRPEALDAHCKQGGSRARLIVMNYPNNPTGASYTEPQLIALAEVCRRHGVLVLSDEIYGELHVEAGHVSIARHYEEGSIVASGLSKWCGAGGWRLGTFSMPSGLGWLSDAMAAAGSETYSTTSAPVQYAAIRAFRGGPDIESYLASARTVLRGLLAWAAGELRAGGLTVVEPRGGFYLFPDFAPIAETLRARGIRTDLELTEALFHETGVSCLPGSEFSVPADTWFVRLALVDFDGAHAMNLALGREIDAAFIRTHMKPVHDAVIALRDFAAAAKKG